MVTVLRSSVAMFIWCPWGPGPRSLCCLRRYSGLAEKYEMDRSREVMGDESEKSRLESNYK